MSDYVLKGASGIAGGQVVAPDGTGTPAASGTFAFVLPIGGNVTLSAHEGGPTGLSQTAVLTKDVDYPFRFSSVTLNAASVGSLYCAEQPMS